MVSAFKKFPNKNLTDNEEKFNSFLSKLRITSEHCIGMLKGRFLWLRHIRNIITDDIKTIRHILQLIDACVILHNLLIEFGEEDKSDWIDDDDFSDFDDAERAPNNEHDELNVGIPAWAPKDSRQMRLFYYLKEYLF